jgi:aryl-alcohol dehydrogenase-like predicted oxidoreductase
MEYVSLGKTGLEVSRLAFGTGTHGWAHRSEQTGLGLDGLANLLRMAFDQGVSFWDSADQYGSHSHVARALHGILKQGCPRDSVVIATKTSSRKGKEVTQDVERFLREVGTDVLDIVLLHCMSQRDWPQRYAEAMEALSWAKEQGKVRAVGISCHDLGALVTAAETDWVDVVLVRINRAGVQMDGPLDQVVPAISRLYAGGKGVYAMKVLGCGQLTREARLAMQYVLQLGIVHALAIGMSRAEHLAQNVRLVEELAPRCPLQPRR